MLITKLKNVTAALAVTALLAIVVGAAIGPALSQSSAGSKARKATDEKKSSDAKPAGQGSLLLVRAESIATLTPDGKQVTEFSGPDETMLSGNAWLSPDGARLALVVTKKEPPREFDNTDPWPYQVVVRKLGADKPSAVIDLPTHYLTVCWSPDGKKLVGAKMAGKPDNFAFSNELLDPDTGKSEPLALPADSRVLDWSRDGKFLVQVRDANTKKHRLGIAAKGDKEATTLCDLHTSRASARLSPDGKRVLFIDSDPEEKDAYRWGASAKPYLIDLATKKRQLLAEFPANAQARGIAWSPDGKRIAYTWQQLHPELLKKNRLNIDDATIETEAFLIVADADGKNAKTVETAKGPYATNRVLGSIDWR